MSTTANEHRLTAGGLIARCQDSRFPLQGSHRAPVAGIVAYGKVDMQIPRLGLAYIRRNSAPAF
jgi:hypothetical protein